MMPDVDRALDLAVNPEILRARDFALDDDALPDPRGDAPLLSGRFRRRLGVRRSLVAQGVRSHSALLNSIRGASPLGLPYTLTRGGPSAPLRSRGSLAALARGAAHITSLLVAPSLV